MRGKLWFALGAAAGFVFGARAGREKYEELVLNARKVWDHPTVQEAAGVAQAQATKLYGEGKDKLSTTKVGEKLTGSGSTTSGSSTVDPTSDDPFVTSSTTGTATTGLPSSSSSTGSSS
ncbi:MAG TPA: hypothetical protein VES42_15270 [Pilimelia sp.]|nr:hypothetical protein [Pilimelia sp.]